MSGQVHTALVPVKRVAYHGENMTKDPISVVDPEAHEIMKKEKARQRRGLELIASENFTTKAVMDALGSAMTNKYSEGYPGARHCPPPSSMIRYYGGNEFIDKMELLCQKRALEVFGLDPELWGVNVQSLSGSPANFAVYTALVEPNGRIMGLDLPDGGHLSHGFFTPARKVSATSMFFQSMPYKVDPKSGLIDYDRLEQNAMLFRPKVLVAGVSCYARHLDYARFRKIADKCGAYLMADMAHISGLVAAGLIPSPFEYADVVTTTTHKSLRGPRGALIFFRKGVRSTNAKGDKIMYDIGEKIASAVFPGLQGGPHNHTIAGIAVALKQCLSEEFVNYSKQILANSQALSKKLMSLGYTLATGGTDNHLCLVDLRPKGIEGAKAEHVLDMAHIACNKNTCPGDVSAFRPGGIRLGTPALTSRGFKEKDFEQVAQFIHEGLEILLRYQGQAGKTMKDFKSFTETNKDFTKDIGELAQRVEAFTNKFDIPGNPEF
ncbi:glycine hydroxymethyltransferase [Ancylostoma duodenale]|uniref:Serine hydroxymethyltransferase n=1 Tax=Ancylostoma duodenale TaxID=51022 RepID=A0A0C2H6U1_9BILA|nr:glycine hydroxymethyltransferase [Ancylostoma duodenale]